jgi:hypothetical protein
MDSFRKTIEKTLKDNRPKLGPSSITTYSATLYNINKKLNGAKTIKWYSDHVDQIMDLIEPKAPTTRKSILSALYVLTNKTEYHTKMLEDAKVTNQHYQDQRLDDKHKEGWITPEDIKKHYDELYEDARDMINARKTMVYKKVIDYIIFAFLGGHLCPPRRSVDFCMLKFKDYDERYDNWYDIKEGKCYFNVYKTAKQYGLQEMVVPTQLNNILKVWCQYFNPTDYVIFSANENRLSSPQITKRLNSILGTKTSVDILRSIYLTNKYGNINIDKMQEDATAMGHSIATQMTYVKKE